MRRRALARLGRAGDGSQPRVELPRPVRDDFRAQIERYKGANEIVWCQEEPRNQGAWRHIQHYLLRHLLPHQKLFYAGRESSASPAAGYKQLHDEQQKELVGMALTMSAGSGPRILSLQPRPLSAGEEN